MRVIVQARCGLVGRPTGAGDVRTAAGTHAAGGAAWQVATVRDVV